MKRCSMVLNLLAAVLLLAGCGVYKGANQAVSTPEPTRNTAEPHVGTAMSDLAEHSEDDSVKTALQWKKVPDLPPIPKLADWPQGVEKTVREFNLYGFDGIKVIVYAKKGSTDYLYAALTAKDDVYNLGVVSGYAYDKDGDVSVEDVILFQKQMLKLTGTVGASATLTRYVSLEGGVPKPVLVVDTGHVRHLDLDFDGTEEVVASSGTPLNTYVYRWNKDHAEMCDLTGALGASSVSISPELAVEAAYDQEGLLRLFWMTPGELRPISQYTREEYDSDNFVKIPYTEQELREIEQLADRIGIVNPFVAGKGIATDYGVQASVVDNDVLQLSYPHFSVRQSKRDLKPQDGTTEQRKICLDGGPAYWVETDSGSGAWYLQRNGTYLSVSTAKPFNAEQLLFVVTSFTSLDNKRPEPETSLMVTRDYLFALNAMNEYLTAWLHRDAKNGMNWVSDEVKRKTDPDMLAARFTGVSNPHHQAFGVTG